LAVETCIDQYAKIQSVRKTFLSFLTLVLSITAHSQSAEQKIYETERAFEKMVAEKGINAGFIEYLSPLGVMFVPEQVNGREMWSKRPPSPASLTWNPIVIHASANGALGYSIGNSIYRPKGSSDTNEIYGHYLSIWTRQLNGEYRAALDTGINHPKPTVQAPDWRPGSASTVEPNEKNLFAGDSSIRFFRMAGELGSKRAYKAFAADDIYVLRDGSPPFVGRDAALDHFDDDKFFTKFVKRRSFIEAGDLAYVYSTYTKVDKNGIEKEKGNFVQVWRLRAGEWQIVADVFIPTPAVKS
jgi:ketosteroid isomerase-like protein